MIEANRRGYRVYDFPKENLESEDLSKDLEDFYLKENSSKF